MIFGILFTVIIWELLLKIQVCCKIEAREYFEAKLSEAKTFVEAESKCRQKGCRLAVFGSIEELHRYFQQQRLIFGKYFDS